MEKEEEVRSQKSGDGDRKSDVDREIEAAIGGFDQVWTAAQERSSATIRLRRLADQLESGSIRIVRHSGHRDTRQKPPNPGETWAYCEASPFVDWFFRFQVGPGVEDEWPIQKVLASAFAMPASGVGKPLEAEARPRYRVAWRTPTGQTGHGEWNEDIALIDSWVQSANADKALNQTYHWRESSAGDRDIDPQPKDSIDVRREIDTALVDALRAGQREAYEAIEDEIINGTGAGNRVGVLCAPESEELIFEQAEPGGALTVRGFPKRIKITPELLAEADPKFISTLVEIRASNGHAFYRITGGGRPPGGLMTFTAELAMGPFTRGEFVGSPPASPPIADQSKHGDLLNSQGGTVCTLEGFQTIIDGGNFVRDFRQVFPRMGLWICGLNESGKTTLIERIAKSASSPLVILDLALPWEREFTSETDLIVAPYRSNRERAASCAPAISAPKFYDMIVHLTESRPITIDQKYREPRTVEPHALVVVEASGPPSGELARRFLVINLDSVTEGGAE